MVWFLSTELSHTKDFYVVFSWFCGVGCGDVMSEGEGVSFVSRLRSGGGSGTSIQVTIPKDIASLLDLKGGDYVKFIVKKIGKGN